MLNLEARARLGSPWGRFPAPALARYQQRAGLPIAGWNIAKYWELNLKDDEKLMRRVKWI